MQDVSPPKNLFLTPVAKLFEKITTRDDSGPFGALLVFNVGV